MSFDTGTKTRSSGLHVVLYVRKAFNCVGWDAFLRANRGKAPTFYKLMWQLYLEPPNLNFQNIVITLPSGLKQGCPSGPIIIILGRVSHIYNRFRLTNVSFLWLLVIQATMRASEEMRTSNIIVSYLQTQRSASSLVGVTYVKQGSRSKTPGKKLRTKATGQKAPQSKSHLGPVWVYQRVLIPIGNKFEVLVRKNIRRGIIWNYFSSQSECINELVLIFSLI